MAIIIMKLLIVLSCVVLLRAQIPTPCETPKIWEGNILRIDRSNRTLHRANQRIKVSYDEVNQRIREIDEYSFSSEQPMYEVIYLHKVGKEYRINLKTRQCNVSAITTPFRPFGVPEGAVFDKFTTIGAAGIANEHLNLITWSFQDGQEKFVGTVTLSGCAPVEVNRYTSSTSFITSTYFDITPGIKDVNVFDPPSECPKD